MKIPKYITDKYTNAKFVESKDNQIEDDYIHLTKTEQIQITDGYFSYVKDYEDGTMYFSEEFTSLKDCFNSIN